MDVPGASIFQGAGSIQLNTSAQRQQEEEELEEQRIRNEKLQNELQNAFDDLSDDEDETISTENQSLRNGSPHRMISMYSDQRLDKQQPTQSNRLNDQEALLGEINNLNNALDSKSCEVIHVTQMLQEIKSQVSELKKRLALSDAEKERAHMTRQQTHELLVESKSKISDQEDVILKLKSKVKILEASKAELATELEHARTLLSDTQHKFALIERNAGFSANKQADTVVKQAQERYSAQIDMMQQQIDGLRCKLEEKESELNVIDLRYKELQRSREALLVEKSETINQLSKTIEDSQRQCHALMAKGDATQENVRLRNMVSGLQRQTEDMQKTINSLTHRLEISENDLDISPSSLGQFNRINKNMGSSSTPIQNFNSDRLSQLKCELNRCMAGQREKRDEIKRLEEQMAAKNAEIKRLKDDENSALVQMMAYKDESSRLSTKLKNLQSELERVTNNAASDTSTGQLTVELHKKEAEIKRLENAVDSLTQDLKNRESDYKCLEAKYEEIKVQRDSIAHECQRIKIEMGTTDLESNNLENDHLKTQLRKDKNLLLDAQNKCEQLKAYTLELSSARDRLSKEKDEMQKINLMKVKSVEQDLHLNQLKFNELKDALGKERDQYENDIKELREKYEQEIKGVPKYCLKCLEQMTKIAKFEVENLDLQNKCSNYLKEVNNLRESLEQTQFSVDELKQKLNLKNEHDRLLADLKEKASQFEHYIKNQSPRKTESRDQSVSTSPTLSIDSRTAMDNEMKLRQESARILATKIKSIEDDFKNKLIHYVNEIETLRRNQEELNYQLQIRATEVHVLKEAILSERTKMMEILQQKKVEGKEMLYKQNSLLKKLEEKLEQTEEQLKLLKHENNERQNQFNAKIKSMERLVQECLDEKKILTKKEDQYRQSISDLRLEHSKIVDELNVKYKSAKKTAANYKKYAEDKDTHIAKENERIKLAYDAAVKKIQEKAAEAVRNKLALI